MTTGYTGIQVFSITFYYKEKSITVSSKTRIVLQYPSDASPLLESWLEKMDTQLRDLMLDNLTIEVIFNSNTNLNKDLSYELTNYEGFVKVFEDLSVGVLDLRAKKESLPSNSRHISRVLMRDWSYSLDTYMSIDRSDTPRYRSARDSYY